MAILGVLMVGAPPSGAEPDTASPAFVDAAPPRPTAEQRLLEIRRRIQAVLVYPSLARSAALEGTALVRFDIENDGTPSDVVLYRSSGRPSLDRAAVRAVTASAPLPWVYGRLEVPVRFALESRQ